MDYNMDGILDPPEINDLKMYTEYKITHVYVEDNSTAYELVGEEWLEKIPF